ncbi:MAG: LCP family protein [Clostridia bacterium]|nr:LCP family protein [Clostridia bacterium]
MGKTRKEKGNIFRYVAIGLVLVFLLSAALLLIEVWEKRQGRFPVSESQESFLEYNGTNYVLKDNIETFLVLGLDKFEGTFTSDSYNNDRQADFLVLFVFDNSSKKCTAVHINRDTMADMSVLGVAGEKVNEVTKQIALAHTYGNGKEVSCRNTADAVSELLLGIKVNHYISLTMDSVPILNDLVGGVEVTVLDDFTGIDSVLVKGESVTLKGEHALNYVRTRYGLEDSSNSTRMERQKQYMQALYSQMTSCIENDDEFIVNAASKLGNYIVSDRSVTQLQEIAKKFTTYEFNEISSIEGESVMGEKFIEFYPDEASLKKIVVDLFYKPKD